jgi:hypothetical protein
MLTQFAFRWMPPRLGGAFSIPTSMLSLWCLALLLIDPAEVDLSAAGAEAVSVFDNPLASRALRVVRI